MVRTCFILDELYPENPGGIARLMHNLLHYAKQQDPSADLHIVLARKKPKAETLQAAFEGVATIHYLRTDFDTAARFGLSNLQIEAVFQKQAEPSLREYRILDAVMHAAHKHGQFDHIEIPDHMGLGAIILQAKRARYAFENTEITCRIHSSLSAIISAEPFHHARNSWLAPRLEMERFALQHADRIIAHLPSLAPLNQKHFGFAASWLDKVEIAFPPVIWPTPSTPNTPATGKDFIFTSRFQPFKRPDLFIKAAITMLDSDTDYEGCFRLISYGFDRDYIDQLRMSIPRRHRRRIRIETNVSAAHRLAAMRGGIIVQPSKFESLCALAYEASIEGRPLLLASDCPAFGNDPHWVNGENCLLFAPSPAALAKTMERARTWKPTRAVTTTPDPLYFRTPANSRPPSGKASLAVVVGPFENAAQLKGCEAALRALNAPVRTYGMADISAKGYQRFTDSDFQGRQLQALAQSAGTDAVVLCSPQALPRVPFLNIGAKTVQANVAFSSQSRDEATKQMRVYSGKHNTMSIVEPRICPPCIMLHKTNLSLIDPSDDKDLMPRLQARLARSGIDLRLCPSPFVSVQSPEASAPSDHILGYDAAPVWRAGLRWIGVDVKPALRDDVVAKKPLILQGKAGFKLSAQKPTTVAVKAAQAFALTPDLITADSIIALTTSHAAGQSPITISLHQTRADIALEAHAKGTNCRALKPGQSFQMRWGPIWQPDHLTLVVSSEGETKLLIEGPLLISLN